MSNAFSTVALVGRLSDPRVQETFKTLVSYLHKREVKVYVSDQCQLDFGDHPTLAAPEPEFPTVADLIITVGGDGTMLYASRLVAGDGVPLLGINRGRLGFLADITPSEITQHMDAVLDGQFIRDERMVLQATLKREQQVIAQAMALNDVVLQRWEMGRMLEVTVKVDGTFVNTHRGDGLIVTTPTGSTAYSLSCDGPIMHPGLNAIAVVPICPHTLSDRPIVLNGQSIIDVSLVARSSTSAQAVCDGQPMGEMTGDETLRVEQAGFAITMIHPATHDYYKILRSKLHWGRSAVENDDQ